MYYELYVDVFFMVNFTMDAILLILLKKLLACPAGYGRVFAGAATGAAMTCIAIVIFSAIILFHELGHFLFAKLNKIVVTEFSLGMGPRLYSFEKGDTRYSLKLLPIGGSCAMRGGDTDIENEPGTFNSASVWSRISVVAAGPVFNFIMAFVLSVIIVGAVGYEPSRVLSVKEGSAAEAAGLKEGDIITDYQGYHIDLGKRSLCIFLSEPAERGRYH